MTDILETNSLPDCLILAMSSLDKGKCGHVGCISGWFEVLRGHPELRIVDLECQDTDWVDRDNRDLLEASLQPHTTKRKKKQQTKKEPRTMFKNCNQ